jgi:hypothetical protein
MGKEQDAVGGDPPDMVGVQMSEEDGADIGRPDTGRGQRAGQPPSYGNRLRRIREPGRGGNIGGERDVVRPIGLQEFWVDAEVEPRVVQGGR